ncbi:MAG: hypothetical protein ACOCQ1_02150 [Halanaerobiaceae bacterium]
MKEKIDDNSKSTNFLIKIYFRRNNSWQGEIKWLNQENGGRLFFRSFLELIFLLQTAVNIEETEEEKTETNESEYLRSWNKNKPSK